MVNNIINWDSRAVTQFNKAINYIAKDSIQNAEKVEQLTAYPEMYPPDKYKINNNSKYRAFELYRLRIAYFIAEKEIRILSVRHTSWEPLQY